MKRILTFLLAVGLLLPGGCEKLGLSLGDDQPTPPAPAAPSGRAARPGAPAAKAPAAPAEKARLEYMADSAVRDEAGPATGAVDTALELSRKYAEATEQLLAAQKTNKALTQENRKLLAQVAKLEMALSQAQKELEDANEQIMEQKRALKEWKDNVMGFRKEMTLYEEAQIDALRKILMLLNGETAPADAAGPAKADLTTRETPDASGEKTSG